ncbi:MAG: hypothetical protein ACXADL_12870 [Candidatus Thorarchaeota archaeon]|jgi:hypothetical protein
MSVGDGGHEERTISIIVRWMNTIRIPMYLCVVSIQLTLYLECIATGGPCDIGTVLVPLGLASLDILMVIWINKRKTGSGFFAYILSFLSLGVAYTSLLPYYWNYMAGSLQPLIFEDVLMIGLGLIVFLISLVELVALLYDSRQIREDAPVPVLEIRTYEN